MAEKNLGKLDLPIRKRIIDKMDFFMSLENPLSRAKKLKELPFEAYRFRVGDYRVVFRIEEDGSLVIISVVWIGHRKEVYKDK